MASAQAEEGFGIPGELVCHRCDLGRAGCAVAKFRVAREEGKVGSVGCPESVAESAQRAEALAGWLKKTRAGREPQGRTTINKKTSCNSGLEGEVCGHQFFVHSESSIHFWRGRASWRGID